MDFIPFAVGFVSGVLSTGTVVCLTLLVEARVRHGGT